MEKRNRHRKAEIGPWTYESQAPEPQEKILLPPRPAPAIENTKFGLPRPSLLNPPILTKGFLRSDGCKTVSRQQYSNK